MNKNEKFVITINREVGTGGRTVGRKLAENNRNAGVPARITAFNIDFGNDGNAGAPARIHAIEAGEGARAPQEWYSLDGRRLDGKPSRAGIYKKV